ncbi:MAG: penicillin-binding transpeptidase domain-containing protein, partial [Alistipes sp.]
SWGLANSRNNYSAWIMKQAKQPEAVADFIHNMGVRSYIDPVYALCLGTFESNVFELVGAYATFANEGVHNTPIFVTRIEDRQGNPISTFASSSQDAVSRETAYTMLTMLKNVITAGTGRRMTWQFGFKDMDIAGKTGTSNNNRDAWFMCITPRLVAGAWVGGEDQSVHLRRGGEGSVMALPIVGDFLTRVYNDASLHISRTDTFTRPPLWQGFDCPQSEQDTTDEQQYTEDNFFE